MNKSFGFYTGYNLTSNILDEVIYADSNFIIDLLDPERPNHPNAFKLLQTVKEQGSIITFSDHTEAEVHSVVRDNITYQKVGKDVQFKDLKEKDMNLVIEQTDESVERAFKIIGDVSEPLNYDPRLIANKAKEIRKAFNNAVHDEDARHLSIMYDSGLNSIASNDKKLFLHTSGLNFYAGNKAVRHYHSQFKPEALHDFNAFKSSVDDT